MNMVELIRLGAQETIAAQRALNCPYCGSEADAGRVGFTARFAVTCSNDTCPVEQRATAGSLQEAIALWNRRVPIAPDANLLEACQLALDLPALIAEYRSRPENTTGAGREIDDILEHLRVAISKAGAA